MKLVPIRSAVSSNRGSLLFPAVQLPDVNGELLVRGDGVLARPVSHDGVECVVVMTRKERRDAWKQAKRDAKKNGQAEPPWSPQTTLRQKGYQLKNGGAEVAAPEVDEDDDGKPQTTDEQDRALSILAGIAKLARGASGGVRRMIRGGDR